VLTGLGVIQWFFMICFITGWTTLEIISVGRESYMAFIHAESKKAQNVFSSNAQKKAWNAMKQLLLS